MGAEMSLQPVSRDERARNLVLREAELEAGKEVLQSRPTRVWFALTGRCNLACLHCPRIAGVEPDIDMEMTLFEKVRREVIPYADRLEFGGNNLGEQIIHPAFATALKEIAASGCRILLTTNATKLDADLADVIASCGVRLRISVEGVASTYEKVRRVSWDKLIAALRIYQDAARRYPEAEPALEFAMTTFADNINEIPELLRTAKELGADKVFVHHLLPKTKEQQLQSLFFHRSTANAAFAAAQERARELGVDLTVPAPLPMGSISLKPKDQASDPIEKGLTPCYLPWTSVNVLENGDVLPCCVGGSLIMGNLKTNSFEEIWNGPAYRRLRRTVNSSRPNSVCAACAMRGGASEDSFSVLIRPSVMGKMKTAVKSYLINTKRKKTLKMLIKARDGAKRVIARI